MATEPLTPLWYQVTSTHAIGHVGLISPSPCLPWGTISVRCVISMFRNHTNWKYTFMFQAFQKHLEPLQAQADHVNEIANALQELQVILSHINVNRLEDLNSRWDPDYGYSKIKAHEEPCVHDGWLWGWVGWGWGCLWEWEVGGRGGSGQTSLPHRGSLMGRCMLVAHTYRQTSYISCTLVANKIVDHSDVVGAAPVGAAATTSSFSI